MFILTLIISVLLAVALTFSAVGKLTRNDSVIPMLEQVGVPPDKIPWLAYLEILGAVGLLVGLAVWPIGVAAAVGVVLYFVGAVAAHLRVKDKEFAPAAGLAVFAVAALVLRVLSA
ncbi:putative integral membrane protein [Rhodococcus sp. AW25M09]|uniref:DoxX family protein n=1 Tax=Rhodococcus sp. AW25M09 TaxID=1268303 RepID=UPI0002AC2F95|nr:DoxX family protein [Rhodococcus sp. AW25M09]CCQ15007.1 putative integral membrane protein [Rhodococcus sp. AW25M09]